jgi:hypothetical protein
MRFILIAALAFATSLQAQQVVKTGNDGTIYSPQPVKATSMELTTPVLSGSVTGTYTLAGTPTLTSPTLTTPTLVTPVISTGLSASGSAANTFAGSTGTFLTSTGANTFGGSTNTFTNAITPSGGVAAAGGFTVSARGCHTGGGVAQIAAAGTDKAVVITEMYVSEIFIPANCTVTGVAVLMGSATEGSGATGTQAALYNSAGTRVAISDDVDVSGFTTDAYGALPFTSTYAAKGPATYYIGIISGVNTNKIRTHIAGAFGAVAVTGLVYSTEAGYATITPPTTFTTGVAPIASLY